MAVAKKVDCLLLERQYTSLGNKLAIRRKRSASAVITQGAVITPLPTLCQVGQLRIFSRCARVGGFGSSSAYRGALQKSLPALP